MCEPQEPKVRSDLYHVKVDQTSSENPHTYHLYISGRWSRQDSYESPFDHDFELPRHRIIEIALDLLQSVSYPVNDLQVFERLERIEKRIDDLIEDQN